MTKRQQQTLRLVMFGMILTLSYGAFSVTYAQNAQAQGGKAMSSTTMEKHTVRPARETHETKTFAPAVASYLQQPLASQLVTVNPNGTPQVTVMWFRYENGVLLFTTTTERIKFRNQQKDARAVFTVVDPTNMYKWVIIHGKLSVDTRDPAVFYRGLAEHYLTGEGLDAWRKMAAMDKRTVLKLTPTRIRTMGFPQE